MAVGFSNTNKPINPRGEDASPKGYNRAALYSGKALDFDGVNDEVDLDGFTMSGNTASFAFYLKADEWNANDFIFDSRPTRLSIGGDGTNANQLQIRSGDIWVKLADISDTTNTNHFVITIDGTTAKLFLNGQSFGVTAILSSEIDLSSNANTALMSYSAGSGAYFNGQLSGFKIFNTALTAAQVADLYNNPEKVVPTGVDNTALKLWLPMQEGAGTTAYDGSPAGFVEDIVTGFTNGTTYPLDSFASSGDDITTAIKTSGFGGCVSNGHYYTNGQKVKVKFTYQKNSGDDLRVLFSNLVTGAGTAKSDIQYVSASGEFEHTFTMTADGIAYLQLGTGSASDSIDAVITDVYVSPNVSANHGTISGATYVNGVGAPVSQTAVIDWNKGTNLLQYSEQFDRGSYWSTTATIITLNDTTAPDGQETADLLKETTTSAPHYINASVTTAASTTYVQSAWVKKKDDGIYAGLRTNGAGGDSYIIFDFDTATIVATGSDIISKGVEAYSNGWYRIYMTFTLAPTGVIYSVTNSSSSVIPSYLGTGKGYYIWGAQLEAADSLNAYIPNHTNTAITSPVLLPQGLTSGRDITGVNLFENVRKQGALNLDGNSWAEVHDNESLDMTTTATLEAWVDCDDLVAAYQIIMVKSSATSWTGNYGRYVLRANQNNVNWWFDDFTTNTKYHTISLSGWNHLVVTKDGTTEKLYINGVLVDTETGAATFTASPYSLVIGAQTSYAENWTKPIAQPRIYNRALTAEEVARNYDAGRALYQ